MPFVSENSVCPYYPHRSSSLTTTNLGILQPIFFHTCSFRVDVLLNQTMAEYINGPLYEDIRVPSPMDLLIENFLYSPPNLSYQDA